MTKSIILTFWALAGVFLLIAGQFFIPAVRELISGPIIFLLPFIIFFLLGIILILLTLKEKVVGALKKFLILTGVSAAGFFVSVLLHNIFYGLSIITNQIPILSFVMGMLDIAFFIIAIFICPLGFAIGAIGSITLSINKKKENI